MDRPELRFRILFEYYNNFHSKEPNDNSLESRIEKLSEPHEIRAAQMWLIQSGLVEGSISNSLGQRIGSAYIRTINNHGIDYVEQVMDKAFTKIGEPDDQNISKTDKIKKFGEKCLNNSATGGICKITLQAITDIMTNLPQL